MADAPINLNRARKARARVQKARQADENAVKFGRTKAERARDAADRKAARDRIDAHRRDNGEDADPTDGASDP